MQEVDAEQRLLRIAAPKGLLELGRQKAALSYLEPLLRVRLCCFSSAGPQCPHWMQPLLSTCVGTRPQ